MPPKLNDGGLVPYELFFADGSPVTIGTAEMPHEPEEETACNGAHWEDGDPYHYKLVGDWELTAVMQCRCSARFMMKITMPPRVFRRWVRKREKERRRKLKEEAK